jgi:hypothetical protein
MWLWLQQQLMQFYVAVATTAADAVLYGCGYNSN